MSPQSGTPSCAMDYAEEQAMELEALEAILGEEGLQRANSTFLNKAHEMFADARRSATVLQAYKHLSARSHHMAVCSALQGSNAIGKYPLNAAIWMLADYTGMIPSGWSEAKTIYKIMVKPELDESDDKRLDLSFDLLFQHPDSYPEVVPHLKVSNTRGLSDAEAKTLTEVMQQEAEANVGMSSIFTVMQAAKDWLEQKGGLAAATDPETLKKQKEEEEERARLEQRAHGTPVNEKTFAEWRKKFDAEMRALKEASGEAAAEAEKLAKMSGKAWFLEKDRPEPTELGEDEEFVDESDEDDTDFEADDDDDAGGEDDDDYDDDDDDDEDEDFLDDLEEKLS